MSYAKTPTTERLAQALEAENDPRLTETIRKARAGHYDDYKSDVPFPIVKLVIDLRRLGFTDLARRARDGEFDAEDWEADEWAGSDEGQETFRSLLRK